MCFDFHICLKDSIMIIFLHQDFCPLSLRQFLPCVSCSDIPKLLINLCFCKLAPMTIHLLFFSSFHPNTLCKTVFNFYWTLNKSMGCYSSKKCFWPPHLPFPRSCCSSCLCSRLVGSHCLWCQISHCVGCDFKFLLFILLPPSTTVQTWISPVLHIIPPLASRVLLLKFPINVPAYQKNYHFF